MVGSPFEKHYQNALVSVEEMYANEEEPLEVRVQFEPDNIPDNNTIKVECL